MAQNDPEMYMSIIVDGMDQCKYITMNFNSIKRLS